MHWNYRKKMRFIVGNEVYVQAADPEVDAEYRRTAYREGGELQPVPTWESFWEQAFEGGMFDSELEEYQTLYGDELSEEEIEQEVKTVYEERYWEAVAAIQNFTTGDDVWRALALQPGVDPTQVDPLGRYWTQDPEAAMFHLKGTPLAPVIFRARLDSQNVDGAGSLWPRVFQMMDVDTTEVRFIEGSPLYVFDVELEDGTVLPINDWRTT